MMTARRSRLVVPIMLLLMLAGCGNGSPVTSEATRSPAARQATEEASPIASQPGASPTGKVVPPASPVNPPAAPEYPPASQACDENIERVSSLGAMGSNCETARRVAAAYDAKVMAGGAFPGNEPLVVDDGWPCRVTRREGDTGELFGVACSKGTGTITFEWGV